MNKATIFSNNESLIHNQVDYLIFLKSIESFYNRTTSENLFTTDSGDLFEVFLNNIPKESRHYYNCNACRKFVNTYGGLVKINNDKTVTPIMWPRTVPVFYKRAVEVVKNNILSSKITGVFYSTEKIWGIPKTGDWYHMAVKPLSFNIFKSNVKTSHEMMAEKKEDHKNLSNALYEFSYSSVNLAVDLLESDALYRSEKFLGPTKWFKDLMFELSKARSSKIKSYIMWKAVGEAPAGYCHIKSSVVGSLLEDIKNRLSYYDYSRRFNEKVNPLKYQRPKAAPSEGNVVQAEKLIKKMNLEDSLKRRFADVSEITALWRTPKYSKINKAKTNENGIFDYLIDKEETNKNVTNISKLNICTFEKFYKTILGQAEKIWFEVPRLEKCSFTAIVGPSVKNSEPIIKWDDKSYRNPYSWYLYAGGSDARYWNLNPGYNSEVIAVSLQPSMWNPNNRFEQMGEGVIFIIRDAKDMKYNDGLMLFPEILKSELHSVRSTIEAYSKTQKLGNAKVPACGLMLQSGRNYNYVFSVKIKNTIQRYKIDRWD